MKPSLAALSVATLSLAMLVPALGQTPGQSTTDNQPTGQRLADRMVPARALLTHTLDANSSAPGAQFRAKLTDNVHLGNGVDLHRGDILLGKVVADDMNTVGKSRLAVRFTQAVLKNGQTVPVKATIVAFYSPDDYVTSQNVPVEVPNTWNDGTLVVDQLSVLHNVDLHSRISSHNSGVFVSTKDKDVKIPTGSELALAIGARNNAESADSGS